MDFSALYHRNESLYSYPVDPHTMKITLRTKKDDDIAKVYLLYECKYFILDKHKEIEITEKISTKYHDFYYIYLHTDDVRLGYVFKIITKDGKTYFYSENKITEGDYDFKACHYDYFQMPYINPVDVLTVNPKFKDRIFYQIFVDRFCDGEDHPINKKVNVKWGDNSNITRMTYAGGNLKGITKHLDHLEDLGVNALYLTPIFEAVSNHKYETYDYYKIAEDFGNEEDLHDLIKKAHKKDILIVLDGVFNHVAYYCPMFVDAVKNGKKSPYFDWFIFHNYDTAKNTDELTYESFGIGKYMPKLNLSNPDAQEYVIKICEHYLKNYHIDGYRMDVADEIPHAFWRKLRERLLAIKPDIFLIAENWHDGHAFLDHQDEFDSIMNYPFTAAVLDFLANKTQNAQDYADRVSLLQMKYKDQVNHNVMNLIDSHDKARFITECGFDEDKTLLAFSFLFMYPGIPMVYYGDEIGLTGDQDPDCRKMFIWDKTTWNMDRYHMIQNLIKLHKNYHINDLDFEIKYVDGCLQITLKDHKTEEPVLHELVPTEKDINVKDLLKNKNILISHNLKDEVLTKYGFVIYR